MAYLPEIGRDSGSSLCSLVRLVGAKSDAPGDGEEEQQAAQKTGNLTGRINTLITADLAQISTSQDVVIVRTCCFHCHDG